MKLVIRSYSESGMSERRVLCNIMQTKYSNWHFKRVTILQIEISRQAENVPRWRIFQVG
jgi:hypothetical protein